MPAPGSRAWRRASEAHCSSEDARAPETVDTGVGFSACLTLLGFGLAWPHLFLLCPHFRMGSLPSSVPLYIILHIIVYINFLILWGFADKSLLPLSKIFQIFKQC